MTWRVLRIAGHLIAHPSQWSEEHGYPAVRSMFEAFVQMRWMLAVEEARPTVWHEFKDYGRGRTKTLKLHTEAAIEEATGQPREILEGLLPKLQEEANRDISEDFESSWPNAERMTSAGAGASDVYDGSTLNSPTEMRRGRSQRAPRSTACPTAAIASPRPMSASQSSAIASAKRASSRCRSPSSRCNVSQPARSARVTAGLFEEKLARIVGSGR